MLTLSLLSKFSKVESNFMGQCQTTHYRLIFRIRRLGSESGNRFLVAE